MSRVLVNAAGAWADHVAVLAGAAPLGLQPRRRSAFTFALPAHVPAHPAAPPAAHSPAHLPAQEPAHPGARRWPTVAAIDETWYFKPDAGQMPGSPANADPVPAHDVQPEEIDIATGIAGIERDTTLTIRRPLRSWAGLRTFAPDGELVIGWDGQREAFFWLAGQAGYGIQSAAGASLLAASLLRGLTLPAQLAAQGVRAQAMAPTRWRDQL